MRGLGLRQLRRRDRRPAPVVYRGDFVVRGFRGEMIETRAELVEPSSPAAVDRYRLAQEHEAEAVAFVLEGLGVGSLSELRRLVETGRAADVRCPTCGRDRYRYDLRGETVSGCVNMRCERFSTLVHGVMVANRIR